MRRVAAWLKTLRTGYAFCAGTLLCGAAPALELFVSDFNNDQVLRYGGNTNAFIDDFIPSGSGGLGSASDMLFRVPEPAALALLLLATAMIWLQSRCRVLS